jgi:hypothetical protein
MSTLTTKTVSSPIAIMPTDRQFESRDLYNTFLGEEPEPPSPLIGRTITCGRYWRELFVPRRNRQFESRELSNTFLGEEPQPTSRFIRRNITCGHCWRGVFVFRAPSRRAPRRFAILVPNE